MMSKISVNRKVKNNLSIKKDTLEWWVICLVFVFSFISNTTLLISLILLLALFKQKDIGAIKILNIITLRTVINPGLAVGIENFQTIKWMYIFLCSLYLIVGYRKIDSRFKKDFKKVLFAILVFTAYNLFASFLFSTLPVVAAFKLLSYSIVFLGMMIGVANTSLKINWIDWIYRMMATLFASSIPFIILPVGYLRNGHSFQGVTNQPNMLGILAGLFIALILARVQLKRFKGWFIPFAKISAVMYMIILSKSRTGFITAIFVIALFLIFSNIGKIKKIMLLNFTGVITIIYVWADGGLLQSIQQFLYKGHEDILFSRTHQVGGLMDNFLRNPWFGSGFAVPVTPYRIFAFSFDYVVEPGNLILAVLSYGGVIGLILFFNYMFKIIWSNIWNFKSLAFLPVSVVLISMGEMVFFSTNNIGIWCYMFLAIYIFEFKQSNKYLNISNKCAKV